MPNPDRMTGACPRIIAFLVLMLALPAVGRAADPAPPVTVDVGIVLASQEGATVDPALSSIQGKLRSMFNYTSYRMLERKQRSLHVGELWEYDLPGNRTMRVTPSPSRGTKVRLAVEIREGGKNLLATTLGLSRGGMVLVGGPPYRKGVLILIISAE